MSRSPGRVIDSRGDLLDRVADLSHDAYDNGLSTDEIIVVLEDVQDEIISRELSERRADNVEADR